MTIGNGRQYPEWDRKWECRIQTAYHLGISGSYTRNNSTPYPQEEATPRIQLALARAEVGEALGWPGTCLHS